MNGEPTPSASDGQNTAPINGVELTNTEAERAKAEGPLVSTHHLAHLAASGLRPTTVASAKIITINDPLDILRRLGWRTNAPPPPTPGLWFPYDDVYGRYRPDAPRVVGGRPVKYDAPVGVGSKIYIPRAVCPAIDDATVELWITEGEKKALLHAQVGFATIGLPGVWQAHDAQKRKAAQARGGDEFTLHPDINRIVAPGRRVVVVFDNDVDTNIQVAKALARAVRLLMEAGANVRVAYLPHLSDAPGVKGLDDLYARLNDESAYKRIVNEARRPAEPTKLTTWMKAGRTEWDPARVADELRRAVFLFHELLSKNEYASWKNATRVALGKDAKELFKNAERTWVELQRSTDPRPKIFVTANEGNVVKAALQALAAKQDDAGVFVRGNRLVRVLHELDPSKGTLLIRREVGTPRIEALPVAWVEVHLANVALWLRDTENGAQHVVPPAFAVKAVANAGSWPDLRKLAAVVETPVLRPDGTVLDQPGFDEATGLLYVPTETMRDIGIEIGTSSIATARAAVKVLLDAVSDFPFESDVHKAVWVSAALTPFARWAFDGPCPLFLIDASTRSSGKTLMAQVLGVIATGRSLPAMTLPKQEDEREKRITALAIAGDPVILIDNVDGELGGASLNAALTGTMWQARILGVSEMTGALPLHAIWYVTANNAVIGPDTLRRTLPIRLVSPLEKPEERTNFAHPHLLAWVRAERRQLVAAILTILRAYWAEGCPLQDLPAFGSYEGWSVLRHLCIWLGLPDPVVAQREAASSSDDDANELRGILIGLEELAGAEWIIAKEILARLKEGSGNAGAADDGMTLRSTLLEYCPGPGGELPSPKKLAGRLRHYRDRVVGDRFLTNKEGHAGVAMWRVSRTKAPVAAPGGSGGDGGSASSAPTTSHGPGSSRLQDFAEEEPPKPPEPPACGGSIEGEW